MVHLLIGDWSICTNPVISTRFKTYYAIDKRDFFFFSDPPHLMKTVGPLPTEDFGYVKLERL